MLNLKMKSGRLIILIFLLGGLFMTAGCKNRNTPKEESKPAAEEQTPPAPKKEKPKLVYDDKGNIIERHAYSYRKSDGSVRSFDSYYYTRDDFGNVVKEVKESYKPDGTLDYKNVNYYTYNDKNQLIELRFETYNADDELQRKARNTYEYNDQGYKVLDLGYFDDGSLKSKIILDPDENGNLRSEEYINYNEDGTEKDHKKYIYSEYGLEKTIDLMKK